MSALTAFICAAMLFAASLFGRWLSHEARIYHTGFPEVTSVGAVILAAYGSIQLLTWGG